MNPRGFGYTASQATVEQTRAAVGSGWLLLVPPAITRVAAGHHVAHAVIGRNRLSHGAGDLKQPDNERCQNGHDEAKRPSHCASWGVSR
jgi:hypothetical protein